MMLQGGVTYEKEAPERKIYIANLMYRYPEETETIELIPTETIVYNNNFGRTNGIVEQGRLRDIREEQEIRAREARLQRRNTSEKPARQRIDYINKVGNVKDFGVPQVNENIVMKAKTKKIQAPLKDYNEIASLMYPTMEEKSQIQVKKKEPILLGDAKTLKEEVLSISDVEKTLFKGGMMGNRPLEKIQPVAKNRKRDRNDEEVSNNNNKNAKSYLWDELINDFEKDNPYGIFWKNYNNMKEANTRGADKYFHSLANCQAAQKGQVVPALKISVAREILDTPKNLIKGLSFKESINDSRDDMDANLFGLKSGLKNFNTECRYLVEKYRPDSLDEKY